MALELHNFIWEGERLVQVETQPHHIAGVLAEIRRTLESSDCNLDDIYSAYKEWLDSLTWKKLKLLALAVVRLLR
ncbi:hypothetical protein NIES22_28850 [Calothrix brevissima NIES-22]|nr:hypothetical protein NIES22_28850 [Calothrix brevissima NIES-22]